MHLRKTKIDKIEEELPELPALEYLNLRECRLAKMDEVKNLFQFSSIRDLNILDNPVESNASSFNMLIAEIIILNKDLTQFCKVKIDD